MKRTAGSLLMRLALLAPLSAGWLPFPSQAAPVGFGVGFDAEFNQAALGDPQCAFSGTNGQLSYNGTQTVVGSAGFLPALAVGTPVPLNASVSVDLTGLDNARVTVTNPTLLKDGTPVSDTLNSLVYLATTPSGNSTDYDIVAGQPNDQTIGVRFEKADSSRFASGTYSAKVTLTCADQVVP